MIAFSPGALGLVQSVTCVTCGAGKALNLSVNVMDDARRPSCRVCAANTVMSGLEAVTVRLVVFP